MAEAPYLVTVPQETVNDESVRIISWRVSRGASVQADEVLCEIETSKALVEINAPVGGVVEYSLAAGEEVPIGHTLCVIQRGGAPHCGKPEEAPASAAQESAPVEVAADQPPARFTPLARKVAAEYDIDLSVFTSGTLVRKNDVLRRAGKPISDAARPAWSSSHVQAAPSEELRRPSVVPAAGVPLEWKALARRKVVEGRILASGRAAAVPSSVTVAVYAPLLRSRLRGAGFSDLGFDALLVFETGRLLRRFPALNAVHQDGRIGEYREVNIGWALDGGQGLVAPVVKSADTLSLQEIAAVMERQADSYLSDSLPVEELRGGTFNISNLSTMAVSFFTPLISEGHCGILGVGSEVRTEGNEMLYLTLAFDHQLFEGRSAALFLQELRGRLEAHSRVESFKTPESAPAPRETICAICNRDSEQLFRMKAYLLKSEMPPGAVCSFCISGF